MLFSDAARSESNFQMSQIKYAAEASTFHLETRVVPKLTIKRKQWKDNGPIHTY